MADEHKDTSKPDEPKGKDNRFTEPLMNFELPDDPQSSPQLAEPLDAAEVVEDEAAVAEEEATLVPEVDDAAIEVVEDEADVVDAAPASDVIAVEAVEDVEVAKPAAKHERKAGKSE